MNNELYNNIVKCFKNFDRVSEDYYGVNFIKIFEKPCLCYNIYFNNNKELKWHLNIEKLKDSFSKLKYCIDERKFLINLYKDNNYNNNFIITNVSYYQYFIIGRFEDTYQTANQTTEFSNIDFFINICLGLEHKISEDYTIKVYTNDIEKLFPYIKNFFEISSEDKDEETEFGIASINQNGQITDTYFEYKPEKIDIKLNYNDDLPYKEIKETIEDKEHPSLMLFYGKPGTGKSSIIKNIISEYPDRNFIFLEGNLLANAPKQNLMEYFIDSENSIFILEDCEKILANRNTNFNPVIPVLLNITDGILGDLLKIKIICTFNTALHNVDEALLRPGRLSLKYEFKYLTKEKASKILGYEVNKEMSLAEIYNVGKENDFSKKSQNRIGF